MPSTYFQAPSQHSLTMHPTSDLQNVPLAMSSIESIAREKKEARKRFLSQSFSSLAKNLISAAQTNINLRQSPKRSRPGDSSDSSVSSCEQEEISRASKRTKRTESCHEDVHKTSGAQQPKETNEHCTEKNSCAQEPQPISSSQNVKSEDVQSGDLLLCLLSEPDRECLPIAADLMDADLFDF